MTLMTPQVRVVASVACPKSAGPQQGVNPGDGVLSERVEALTLFCKSCGQHQVQLANPWGLDETKKAIWTRPDPEAWMPTFHRMSAFFIRWKAGSTAGML